MRLFPANLGITYIESNFVSIIYTNGTPTAVSTIYVLLKQREICGAHIFNCSADVVLLMNSIAARTLWCSCIQLQRGSCGAHVFNCSAEFVVLIYSIAARKLWCSCIQLQRGSIYASNTIKRNCID
jgi:hypothetical protein